MHRKFAPPTFVAAPIPAMSLSACGSAANAEACVAYDRAHTDIDVAVSQQELGAVTHQQVRDQFVQLHADIAAAADLAEGELRINTVASSVAALEYQALATEESGTYFFLQANDAVGQAALRPPAAPEPSTDLFPTKTKLNWNAAVHKPTPTEQES